MKFELGGIKGWAPEGHVTVNLVEPTDIVADILDVDSYCEDGSVDLFRLSHTLEHVPSQHYVQFLKDLYRKLRLGGCVEVVQTDVEKLLDLVYQGKISLRAARLAIFCPADRLRENPHHQHFNLWSEDMLWGDFEALGYERVEFFNAGSWSFDQNDEIFPEHTARYHGVRIPNLGVCAYKAVR